MATYKPSAPFNVAMYLLTPTVTRVAGVTKKTFSTPENSLLFNGSFRTFGGTERVNNDVLTIEDTATIDTWYDPAFKADCRIQLAETGEQYEILGTPENINMRNQYIKIRVRKVGGKP